MNNTEILYDHYKDTLNEVKKTEIKRNKLFLIIVVHIFILFLISIRPESMYNVIVELLREQWKLGFYFSINTVQIFIMISMLYCVVRYYQINIYIDKNYPYIQKIEDELANCISKNFGREGKNYLNNYPKTQNIIYYSYKYIFPTLFIVALVYRLIVNDTWGNHIIKILESVITIILCALNILYMLDMYNQEKN